MGKVKKRTVKFLRKAAKSEDGAKSLKMGRKKRKRVSTSIVLCTWLTCC